MEPVYTLKYSTNKVFMLKITLAGDFLQRTTVNVDEKPAKCILYCVNGRQKMSIANVANHHFFP
jgi:hypothetical protein